MSIFSSGSGHVTGVTSPNVVVGGGGDRSRRSRRKDGGAVGEALPLPPPPLLLSPPSAKLELDPQGVSSPHHPDPTSPGPPGREAAHLLLPSLSAGAPRAPRPALLTPRPLPSSRLLVLAGVPREHRPPGSWASGLLRAPLPAPPMQGRLPAGKGRAHLPVTRSPEWPGRGRICLICPLPSGACWVAERF